jgi:hypothetical protein
MHAMGRLLAGLALLVGGADAFSVGPLRASMRPSRSFTPAMEMEVRTLLICDPHARASSAPAHLLRDAARAGRAQELEFIIYPDGRVEERVRGIKGANCQEVTAEINKALGEVYESKPTKEMFEQKVELSVDAENTVSDSGWGTGSSTWGSSSDDGDAGGSQW